MSYKRGQTKVWLLFYVRKEGFTLRLKTLSTSGSKQNVKIFYVQLLGSLQEGVFFIECYIKIKQETGKHSGYLTPQFNVFLERQML